MRFLSRHDEAIASLDDWRVHGAPAAAERHWKPGRSAYELAADWIAGDAASRVGELLALRPELEEVRLIEGIAEKQTQFDDVPGGKRNHDLLIRARCDAGPVTIAVEGKADESFDDPLWLWRQKALNRSPSSRAAERLDRLTRSWFGTTIDRDIQHPALGCIGYQLFSALAGTLADAKADGSHAAVLLIHEFVTQKTDDAKHDVNARVLDDFLVRLMGEDVERSSTADGWITAPVAINGDGTWMQDSTPVSFAKLTRVLR